MRGGARAEFGVAARAAGAGGDGTSVGAGASDRGGGGGIEIAEPAGFAGVGGIMFIPSVTSRVARWRCRSRSSGSIVCSPCRNGLASWIVESADRADEAAAISRSSACAARSALV